MLILNAGLLGAPAAPKIELPDLSSYPIAVAPAVTWESSKQDGFRILYLYTLEAVDSKNLPWPLEKGKEMVIAFAVVEGKRQYKAEPEFAALMDAGYVMVYTYNSRDGKHLFTVEVSKKDFGPSI